MHSATHPREGDEVTYSRLHSVEVSMSQPSQDWAYVEENVTIAAPRSARIVVGFDSWEQSVAIMPDRLGDKAAWGSRYPNHDAAGPDEARTMLEAEGVDAAMIDRLMGGNAAELFRLQVPAPA